MNSGFEMSGIRFFLMIDSLQIMKWRVKRHSKGIQYTMTEP
jgi:hypothetical protein